MVDAVRIVCAEGEAMLDDSENPVDEFAVPAGRNMRRLSEGEQMTFRTEEATALQAKLDEFDAVRTRGDIESRSAHLGGRVVR